MTPLYEYSIYDAGSDALVNVETYSDDFPAPKHTPLQYKNYAVFADGTARGTGRQETSWAWDFLTIANYSVLRAKFPLQSYVTQIRTKNNLGSYDDYNVVMILPTKEPGHDGKAIKDIVITFKIISVIVMPED